MWLVNHQILRDREFRLWFAGQALSLLGDGMVNVALAFAVLAAGGSASNLGAVFAARALASVACLLVGGVVADRTTPRSVMVSADVVRMASQGALAILVIAGSAEIWTFALLAGVTGGAAGFYNPASTALLPGIVAPDHLQQANGLRAAAWSTGETIGPTVAGLLVVAANPGWALAFDALTFGLSAVFLLRLRIPARTIRERTSFISDLRGGWGTFRSRRWVWTFVASAAISNLLWTSWIVLGPFVAEQRLGGAAAWGVVGGCLGVGGFVGGLLAARAQPRRPLLVAALAIQGLPASLLLLAAGASTPVLAIGSMLTGGALVLCNTLWQSTLQRHIPAETLARVSAYEWFGSLAFEPVGLAIWGPISIVLGITTSLWVAFAAQLGATLILLAIPEIRDLPAYAPKTAPVPS